MPRVYCAQCGRRIPTEPGSARTASPADRAGAARVRDTGRAWVPGRSRWDGRLPPAGSPERPGESTSTISLGRTDDDLADELFPDSASFGALPPGSALLLVMRGPNAGSRFRLDGDLTTAGRHPDSDIFLDDVTVSRRHAEFYRHGAGSPSATWAASTVPT